MKKSILILLTLLTFVLPIHAQSPLAWGIDVGTGIDLSGHDMSTLNVEAQVGYKNSIIDIAGIGAGIHMMVSNSCRAIPVYGIIRTSFRPEPSLCFLDLRVGCAFDAIPDNSTQAVVYLNPSIGFNLARGKNFTSFLTVGYTYNGMSSYGPEDARTVIPGGLHMASVSVGISF